MIQFQRSAMLTNCYGGKAGILNTIFAWYILAPYYYRKNYQDLIYDNWFIDYRLPKAILINFHFSKIKLLKVGTHKFKISVWSIVTCLMIFPDPFVQHLSHKNMFFLYIFLNEPF